MNKITITEGLAEIKTLAKRVASKRSSMGTFLTRLDGLRDPIQDDGGSVEYLRREAQAINDLEERIIAIRREIARANDKTAITINGEARSMTDWLNWRKEIAPYQQSHLLSQRQHLNTQRTQAARNGAALVSATDKAQKPTDIIVNISEAELARQVETLEDTLGQLDGQLSLRNATVMIELPA